jgi:hypothetical protein
MISAFETFWLRRGRNAGSKTLFHFLRWRVHVSRHLSPLLFAHHDLSKNSDKFWLGYAVLEPPNDITKWFEVFVITYKLEWIQQCACQDNICQRYLIDSLQILSWNQVFFHDFQCGTQIGLSTGVATKMKKRKEYHK